MALLILGVIVLVGLPLMPEIMHALIWLGAWAMTGSRRDPLADPDPSDTNGTNLPQCGRCGHILKEARSNRCPECGVLFVDGGVVAGAVRQQLIEKHRPIWRRPAILFAFAALLGTFVAAAKIVSPNPPPRESIFTPESVEISTSNPSASKPGWKIKISRK